VKVGDLVQLKERDILPYTPKRGRGLVMTVQDDGRYVWVWFAHRKNPSRILIKDLEIVSESG